MNHSEVIEQKRAPKELQGLIHERVLKMQAYMREEGLDAAIFLRPENVFYFSNFNPIIISTTPYFLLTPDDSELLLYALRYDHAINEGAADKVVCYGHWGAVESVAETAYEAIQMKFGKEPIRLGLECDYASLDVVDKLKQTLNITEIVNVTPAVNNLRLIKDAHEIKMCRISGELVDLGVVTAFDALNQGASEAQAATEGQYAMRQLWQEKYQEFEVCGFSSSETAAIDTLAIWCMSNERLNYGCECPSGYIPLPGDLTMPQSWARIGGYNVENERTVIVHHLDSEKQRAYDSMLRARETIFEKLAPGAIFEDLYLGAMDVFIRDGFGDILPGRCGHGMGLSTHEFPSVTKGNKASLSPGMILTVEPGLMSPSLGAVRNSDTVLITEHGFEFLTNSPRGTLIIKK